MKKTTAQRNARIERENALFRKLSAPRKRVALARDGLAQLASGQLIATTGTWVNIDDDAAVPSGTDSDTDLRDVIGEQTCETCALGGLFVCAVKRVDALKISELENGEYVEYSDVGVETEDVFAYLRKFFSESQLNAIEAAFEQGNGVASGSYAARSFASDIDDAELRMRLILENIVANKGTFDPSIKPEQVITYVTPNYRG